jgi:CheY-like chemotaxis protein
VNKLFPLVSNILLVDDDEDDQNVFKTVVTSISKEIKCIAVDHPEIAIDILQTKQVHPDIIFIGLNLETVSGQEFIRQLKQEERLKEIPVVILSLSADPKIIQEVKELGVREFYVKPSRYSDLKKLIEPIVKEVPSYL